MTRQTADLGGRGERPTFDYIVIGAGPAGCAAAARLAQSSAATSVALVVVQANAADQPAHAGSAAGL